jgi:hypothetical protein
MKFIKEFSDGFKPWSGAVENYERIIREKSPAELEKALEQIFDDEDNPPTETQINDLLWFEPEEVYKILGMKPDNTTTHTLEEIAAAWLEENKKYDFARPRVEIVDSETVRVHFLEDENDPDSEQTEDLDAEEVAGLFGDDCGEIDEDAQTVETWKVAQ